VKKIIIANWKMNKTIKEGLLFIESFLNLNPPLEKIETVISPSYVLIYPIYEAIKGSSIYLSAQNLFYEKDGPYTGEVSGEVLKEAGCKYVLIGHSERRKLFYETPEVVYRKFIAAKNFDLIPVICFGEELNERKNGKTISVIDNQLKEYYNYKNLILAYEPVWSIGTGIIPKEQEIEEVGNYVKERFNNDVTLIYGGSVDKSNIDELLNVKNIDGFLVGRASLDPLNFFEIIKALVV